ncbi:YihY/virulence factor BrkB family protein [Sphingobacterium alkalisoli]|uniref:YihY/virulence factor BrkB family protein n=1 Tax=Sphingobacterium alkalisoli TaxID=1874115 RepID=A0A4U0GTT8_9SPHI|nr:YihY/virulence factor BrkB family protein [Sphingobacterium alkalisoli]TJY62461.1 YihY/virulence factor BrkB family protein [Sphingobacterium alkalisoli]
MQSINNASTTKEKESFLIKAKGFGQLLVDTGNGFIEDKCMKLSASLAYYTVFSIGPLIIILIWALGFFYGNLVDTSIGAREEVMDELNGLLGRDITILLEGAIQKISFENRSNIGLVIGISTLVITSTTIFLDIQVSINEIWRVKPKPKKGWLKLIINRLISFSMILGLSFLLMASLLISSIIGVFTSHLEKLLDNWNIQLWDSLNTGITFLVIAVLFGFIFAVLPDARVRFKDILGGSLFTAFLFMVGKYGISFYLSNNATATAYGAAGSIIILLAWVYYSAAILYFGAEFTKEYAIKYGRGIQPASFAVLVKQTELEIDPETGKREIVKKHNEPVK